jgi:hypothetical protein
MVVNVTAQCAALLAAAAAAVLSAMVPPPMPSRLLFGKACSLLFV